MPYQIVHKIVDGKVRYAVKNKNTGKTHGWTTREKAEAQMRLLQGIEHGLMPRGK